MARGAFCLPFRAQAEQRKETELDQNRSHQSSRECIVVGLLGMGVVGTEVARLLLQRPERVAAAIGLPVVVKGILVRDLSKPRAVQVPDGMLNTDAEALISDPTVAVVIELIGGHTPAADHILRAVALGKHVVTANKAVIGARGPEILNLAAGKGVQVRFEASVGAGTPIIAPLTRDLAANDVTAIRGVVNGTTNYVLTQMAAHGAELEEAVDTARELGYAEADPTGDVDGTDAASKIAILATQAWGVAISPQLVYREGISSVQARDFTCARRLGYTIKLLATARRFGDMLDIRVHPALVPATAQLAAVDDVMNAVAVDTDLAGRLFFHGQGAGSLPTSSAVVGDLIQIARDIVQHRPAALRHIRADGISLLPISDLETRYYLRLGATHGADILPVASAVLGELGVLIDSAVAQSDGAPSEVVLTTHTTRESSVQSALATLRGLDGVASVQMLRIEDLAA